MGSIAITHPKEKVSYASITLGYNMVAGVTSLLLLYYYTDVLLLPLPTVTSLLLAVRVIDGAIDPFIGYYMDRRRTAHGKYKGYLIAWSFPFCLLSILMFLPLEIGLMSLKIAWYGLIFLLWSIVFSILECANLPLLVVMDPNPNERYSFNTAKILGGIVATLIARYGVLELVKLFGQGSERKGYAIAMTILAVVGFFAIRIPVRFITERYATQPTDRTFFRAARALLRDKKILTMLLFFLSHQMASAIKGQASVYYMKYIVQRQDLTSIFLLSGVVSSLAVQPLILWAAKRVPIQRLIVAGFVLAAASMQIIGFADASVWLVIGGNILYGVATAFPANLVYAYLARLADHAYGDISATLYSFLGVASRIALSVSGALISFILSISGYIPNLSTGDSESGIQVVFIMLTSLLYLAAGLFAILSFSIKAESQETADESHSQIAQ